MTDLIMRKKNGRLETVDIMGSEELARLPADRDLLITVTRKPSRTLEQLRFVWALASKIADARDDILDKDVAMDVLCELCRHVRIVVNPITGHAHLVRNSISTLSVDEMSRLIERMIYVTCTTILPGVKKAELRGEVEAMIAPRRRQTEAA